MTNSLLILRITRIDQETSNTRSYWLESTDGEPVLFQPGQFLTFLLLFNGHKVRRSYSISSLPARELRITIKRVQNGDISRYLLDTLKVGDQLTSLPPAGRFVLGPSESTLPRDIVLFGAGSGITPLLALLLQILTGEPESHVTLLYSNTHSSGVIFGNELTDFQQRYTRQFTLIHLLSWPDENDTGLGGTIRAGRLSNTLLETLLPSLLRHDPAEAKFYVCGPTDYMRMVLFTLIVSGFRADQIRRENFVVEPINLSPAPPVAHDRTILLRFRNREIDIEVPAYVSILQAALDAGIHLPYSCRGGRCSTCAAHCTAGHVVMTINDVLTERDLAEGWILTCTGYPDTDGVVIEL